MSLQCISSNLDSSIQGSDKESQLRPSKVGHQHLPRPERKRRRSKEDRGLPEDKELQKLAQVYLGTQTELWPELAEKGVISQLSPDVLNAMTEDFKFRHRKGTVNPEFLRSLTKFVPKLGGGYFRFSCDNSNPLSIADQMVNCLRKAKERGCFIPWQYVYADFSVTGLDASRPGYSAYKEILENRELQIQTTYIDDFSRASRDDIEWWKLAHRSKHLQIGLVGASDSFDLGQPDWDMKVTVYALLSRLFIKQLREKVRRGMSGAARRGTCLGKLPLGFTRQVKTGPDGSPIPGKNGKPIHVPCHDPQTVEFRRQMYDLFVNQNLSAHKIAKWMNEQKVDGWNGWTRPSVKKLLRSPSAIGIFIWNQYRNEYDHEQEKSVRVKNPRKDWEFFHDSSLAIVELSLWKAARRKLGEIRQNSPLTGRTQSRNQKCATTLFSGTLICGYCGREIILQRSADKYKQLGCLEGWTGVHDCQLSSSKSTKIVEESLLKYLFDTLLNPATVDRLLNKINQAISRELAKPQVDIRPLETERRNLLKKIQKWTTLIDETEDMGECRVQNQKLKQAQTELAHLEKRIREAKAVVLSPIPSLQRSELEKLLEKLRDVLNSDIPVAAQAIRNLTGPITIRQEPDPDRKRRSRWIATFSPQLLNLLEILCGHGAVAPLRASGISMETEAVTVPIEKIPRYVRLAPEFLRMKQNGASIQSIACTYRITCKSAQEILHFAETGERPVWKSRPRSGDRRLNPQKYITISSEVVQMVDKGMTFTAIAKELGVGQHTVTRAYDYLRPEAVKQAAATGKLPRRGGRKLANPAVNSPPRKSSKPAPRSTRTDMRCGTDAKETPVRPSKGANSGRKPTVRRSPVRGGKP